MICEQSLPYLGGVIFKFLAIFGDPTNPTDTFGARFGMAAVLWVLLIIVSIHRYSAVNVFKPHLLIGIIGMSFGLAREMNMLVLEWGFFNGIYKDRTLFLSFSPTEHFWMMLCIMFICWCLLRAAEIEDWTLKLTPRWLWVFPPIILMTYSTLEWFTYVAEHTGTLEAVKFRDVPSDTIWHATFTLILLYTISKLRTYQGATVWMWLFLISWLFDHFCRTMMFGFGIECNNTMILLFNLHIWGIGFYLLHVSSKVVTKLNKEETKTCPCTKYIDRTVYFE